MDVCSPKDGFVVEVHVADRASVSVGQPLFTMDVDDEGRTRNRLTRLDEVRAQLTAQYQGDEQETARKLAQLAVSMAEDLVQVAEYNLKVATDKFEKPGQGPTGEATRGDVVFAQSKVNQANMTVQKSKLDLKNFEFAIKRHLAVSGTIGKLLADELSVNSTKQKRLVVLSPIQGKVTFHMAVNSFARIGRPVVSVG